MNAETLGIAVQGGGGSALKVFFLLTVLSFAPAIVVSLTSFTRIIIVLSLLRQALGTPQLPPNPVLIGLSLFLTGFIMAPTMAELRTRALNPYLDETVSAERAFEDGSRVMKGFMLPHTREQDLITFMEIAQADAPNTIDDLPISVVAPAFMVSELTTAFRMGLAIFIPLLLIDLLVAAVLMSLGMMMVPPQLLALPIKLGVFVLADGWQLVIASLARSFHG